MKRILTAGVTLSLLCGTAAMAQPGHDRGPGPDRHGPDRHGPDRNGPDRHGPERHGPPGRGDAGPGHRWGKGERLPRTYYSDKRYYVNDWRARRLSAPPRGYRWVKRDDNYLLVAATTGLIASVIAASR